jgi:hypothetical protein
MSRAQWVVDQIADQPHLDGQFGKLASMVRERFKVKRNPSEEAVTRGYEIMNEERKKARAGDHLVAFCDRKLVTAIHTGERAKDPRSVIMGVAELRRLYGVGEPDRVKIEGKLEGATGEGAAILEALRLTNAKRQAEIEREEAEIRRLEAELAKAKADGAAPPAETVAPAGSPGVAPHAPPAAEADRVDEPQLGQEPPGWDDDR